MKLQGKVAIVTGASRGIGKAIALACASEGAKVVVAARTERRDQSKLPGTIYETAEAIQAAGGEALPVRCDVTDEQQVVDLIKKTLDAFGAIDILVNNAAVQINGPITQVSTKHWDLGIRVNVRGPFLAMKFALPHMIERRAGSIINVTSGAALSASPMVTNYVITKVALERLSAIVAEQCRPHNIAVNCFDPGPVLTEGARTVLPKDFDLSRHRPPEVCGPPAVWLAMQTAQTFTGKVARVEDWIKDGRGRF